MTFYAIYDHPKDHPDSFVIRAWVITSCVFPPTPIDPPELVSPDISVCRKHLDAKGYKNIGRMPEDDPVIAEVYIHFKYTDEMKFDGYRNFFNDNL